MNGAADMGGMMGFGPVCPEGEDEPKFHAEWERRVFALTLAMGATGQWNLDMSRSARESLPPPEYLSKSYYGIWLAGLEKLMTERGLVTPEEIETGRSLQPPKPLPRILNVDAVATVLAKGGPTERETNTAARFKVGDRVRAKNMHPTSHTRLPRYVRGHEGVIELVHGAHVFPDSNALGQGEQPQWLYTVRFKGTELWGEAADPTLSVSVDAWESYLEPVA
ncbi:nitrile hydratase subunit beta [uncultured Ferrovibrio sp.]|jgi:nitrile hydratase beta subunit|uniref:nitrile hydratase subunit beta n=1 Tax=uncultured Ferrovibrio sp. TaxID=1576913 RepID=UPI00261B780B|nr:nitrile hydratase subunit beta [uncultured Ferrovibrio sp.]